MLHTYCVKHFFYWLTAGCAFLLPLHGGITVFLPENFRWWKEIFLLLLGIIFLFTECKHWQKKGAKKWFQSFSKIDLWAVLFFLLADVLFFIHPEKLYAFYALRYLTLPVITWFLVSRISHSFSDKFLQKNIQNFARFFVFGLLVSALFALLFQQLQISETLLSFYSGTPSSWVPGQVLQKWHEVGAFVRWQGLSSGPIEFSHLLVLGIGIFPLLKYKKYWTTILFIVFSLAVFLSFSRAAVVAVFILILGYVVQNFDLKKIVKKYKNWFLVFGVLMLCMGLFLAPKILQRAGTSDHFTRPVQALKLAVQKPLSGNLAQIGPAARMKNLQENNDDKALIAENVLVDVFAQMGVFGILFFALFLLYLHKNLPKKQRPILYALFFMMNLATIFDMTPISIAYFYWFGLGYNKSTS